jgi:CDP-glucose 4,6-dehydratase
VIELVRRILSVMDCNLEPVIRGEAICEIRDQYLSAERARALGWHPLFELDEGLRQTVDWYRSFMADH